MAQPAVYGVRETLKELKDIDKKLYWQAINEVKAAAEPLRSQINTAIPSSAPLSGMNHKGRTGWTNRNTRTQTKVGGRKAKNANEWALVSIRVMSAAGQIADMSGAGSGGNSGRGAAMIRGLNAAGGQASRYVWPTANRAVPAITMAVLDAVRIVESRVNKNLVVKK
jgi:hypothetical protein